jgi:Domain of unknown function (DUF4261)
MKIAHLPPATTTAASELGPFAPYGVELLLAERVRIEPTELLEPVRAAAGNVELIVDMPDLATFGFLDHRTDFADVRDVPMIHILAHAAKPPDPGELAAALEQSVQWKDARRNVERCRATLIHRDTPGLGHIERLDLFHRVLTTLVVSLPVLAIHWVSSQRLVDPAAFVENARKRHIADGAVNVRMFNVADGEPRELLMDTCGMASFGLPDLELRFRDLEPASVAGRLFDLANYLFENGDIIQDRDTVDGLGTRWRCQRQVAATAPPREVLRLTPTDLHAT